MKTTIAKVLPFIGLIFITGCKKSTTTDDVAATPQAKTSVPYYAKAVNSTPLTVNSADGKLKTDAAATGSVAWLTATIYAEEIEFDGVNSGANVSTKVSLQKVIDIMSGSGLAGSVDLTQGNYSNTKEALHLKKSAKTDLAFNISGTYTNTKGTPVALTIANSDEFEVKLDVTGFSASATSKVTVNYDLSKLLTGITAADLDAAQHTTIDNVLLISSSVNVALYNKVKANWQTLATAVIQ